MKALAVLSLVFLIACATMATEENLQNAKAHYKIGVAYLNDNKAQLAFVEFQKANDLNPNDKEVLNAIGIIYLLYFEETAKAADFFEKAAKIDPNYSEAYNNLGVAHEKLGNFETALSFYRKAVSNLIYATPEKAYIGMGTAYYRLGKYEDALNAYKEAIKRAPNLSLPYLKMSLCYNALGRYGDASSAMTHALKLHPVYKGDREKALDDFVIMKLKAKGYEEKDIQDYIEIIKY
ncbi:MAG: tetratricopeptide repeat protein [Nitrospirota bacterium]|nr:tetratricopeptide repeat protein [Nitrospirota bacterium]